MRPGTLNDISMWERSSLFDNVINGEQNKIGFDFLVNGETFSKLLYQ